MLITTIYIKITDYNISGSHREYVHRVIVYKITSKIVVNGSIFYTM
jgi:hypothetical protein